MLGGGPLVGEDGEEEEDEDDGWSEVDDSRGGIGGGSDRGWDGRGGCGGFGIVSEASEK